MNIKIGNSMTLEIQIRVTAHAVTNLKSIEPPKKKKRIEDTYLWHEIPVVLVWETKVTRTSLGRHMATSAYARIVAIGNRSRAAAATSLHPYHPLSMVNLAAKIVIRVLIGSPDPHPQIATRLLK
eukprot:5742918-Amphidinium_carterae.1